MTDPDFSDVTCPHCRGEGDAELLSLFGGSASDVLFYCGRCRSCFNWVKWRHWIPAVPMREGADQ